MKRIIFTLTFLTAVLLIISCGNQDAKQDAKKEQKVTATTEKAEIKTTTEQDSAAKRKEKEALLQQMMAQGTSGAAAANEAPTPEQIGKKYFQEAARHGKAKRFPQALMALNKSIEAYPDNAAVWFARGSIKWQTDDLQGAKEDFSQCLELMPDHEKAALNIGQILIKQGKNMQAIELYNELLIKYPNTAMSYYNRGIAFSNIKDYNTALDDFNQAIELDPNYSMAYNNRGNVYFLLSQKDKACSDWKKSLELGNDMSQKSIDAYCK